MPEKQKSHYRILFPLIGLVYILALGFAAFWVSVQLSPKQNLILGIFYLFITFVYAGLALFCIFGGEEKISKAQQSITNILAGREILRGAIFSFIVLLPLFFVFTELTRGVMQNLWFRFLIFLPLILIATIFWPFSDPKKYWHRFLATSIIFSFTFFVWLNIRWVVDYPFSLTWSEGNRFYDYSLIFGKSIYQYNREIEIPYSSPGRYGLWGIWFLFPNLLIWFHRLWNAVLWIIPALLLGWFAGRAIEKKVIRVLFAFWIVLFLNQGPVYAPILLAAVLVVAFNHKSLRRRLASTALASTYAGLSRWTWMFAPGIWGGLIDVGEYYPQRNGTWLRRIWPAILIGLAGSLPGLLVNWERFFITSDSTMSLSQPLLWFRLLPNSTYSSGILLGVVLASGSLVVLLLGLILTRNWQLDKFQLLVFSAVIVGTFLVGAVISTKIGGGSNLHNFDMYFITLVVVLMIFLDQVKPRPTAWPIWMRVLLVITILIPSWHSLKMGAPSKLPSPAVAETALRLIRDEVTKAAANGEVLFMDQRQLLTFGYIENIDLIPEYEKKYMMDQAMAENKYFFYDFYGDLENHRFAMIVSEPLNAIRRDQTHEFGDENNAWVRFVSKYVLCFYKPYLTIDQVNIQLLIPREGPVDCH